jgi:hypothetical protein
VERDADTVVKAAIVKSRALAVAKEGRQMVLDWLEGESVRRGVGGKICVLINLKNTTITYIWANVRVT